MSRLTNRGVYFFMKKKRILCLCLIALILTLLSNISFEKIINLPNEFYVNYQEVEQANKENLFGKMINLSLEEKDIIAIFPVFI